MALANVLPEIFSQCAHRKVVASFQVFTSRAFASSFVRSFHLSIIEITHTARVLVKYLRSVTGALLYAQRPGHAGSYRDHLRLGVVTNLEQT